MTERVTRMMATLFNVVWPDGYEHLPRTLVYYVDTVPATISQDDEEDEFDEGAREAVKASKGVEPISFDLKLSRLLKSRR